MATRFVPTSDFIVADKKGRKRVFKRAHTRRDGTIGYLPEEITDLYRDHLKMFRETQVTGDGVEQATAAPGEKRSVSRRKPAVEKPTVEPEEDADVEED